MTATEAFDNEIFAEIDKVSKKLAEVNEALRSAGSASNRTGLENLRNRLTKELNNLWCAL